MTGTDASGTTAVRRDDARERPPDGGHAQERWWHSLAGAQVVRGLRLTRLFVAREPSASSEATLRIYPTPGDRLRRVLLSTLEAAVGWY